MKQLRVAMQRMREAPDDVTVLFGGDTNLRDTEVSRLSLHHDLKYMFDLSKVQKMSATKQHVCAYSVFLVFISRIHVITKCTSLVIIAPGSISGGQGGAAPQCLRRVGATGKAGALPLHMGHQNQQQQDCSLHQSLPLRPNLLPPGYQGRRPTPGP